MKKLGFLVVLFAGIFLAGCEESLKFMDVDNPDAAQDLKNLVQSGNLPKIDTDKIIPDALSGTRDNAKGYVNQYYEDSVEKYVDKAKDSLSGAKETLKGYYNSGVDELNQMISDKVNSAVSGELNKLKI